MHNNVLISMACAVALGVGLTAAAEEMTGPVAEIGYGKIIVKDKTDTARQISLSQRDTNYSPEDWRPAAGDRVTVTFTETESRRGKVLEASLVKLEKAGPSSIVNLKSPVVVTVAETGRTGIKATLPDGKEIKFSRHGGTVYTPAGWQPAAGEKVRVTFRVQPARVGFGLNYVSDAVEKVK